MAIRRETRCFAIACLLGLISVIGACSAREAYASPTALLHAWPDATIATPPPNTEVHIDLDGDGRLDVARASGGVEVVLSRDSGSKHLDLHTTAAVKSLIATDIDRDGDADLVTLNSDGIVIIWINSGAGQFTPQQPRPPTTPPTNPASPDYLKLVRAPHVGTFVRSYNNPERAIASAHALPPALVASDRLAILSNHTHADPFFASAATRAPPALPIRR